MTNKTSKSQILVVGATALILGASSAFATLTIDLRAASGSNVSISGGGKTVAIGDAGAASSVVFEVWAQVQNAAPTNSIFGIQALTGSIKSTTTGGTAAGAMTAATIGAPFNAISQNGAPAELSSPTDTVGDLGSNSTDPSANFIKFRKDPANGGELVGTVLFATNNTPLGSTVQAISNGFQFLMGTATLNLSSGFTASSLSMNWVIPTFASVINKKTIAQWTDADNIVNEGSTKAAEMFVGSSVVITAVPEPSAFGMVLIGALGLVGFRRLGFRRSA